ncbi:MAG: tRNA threonylcarbamoyladenosine biosynthesis protein TsaB [Bacteroides sp. SM1_62]|nr:MAG: tRNA threonylcarbamoyladenosine biosynthesis protein TsaB [Bacteroides sp. SM23_62]KPL26334.1 MAG: tRNA threonylcarbamoyladenosine biosynthesis protein TsaB [Bacteroides sp. SM1_62]
MALILNLDTSTQICSVALALDGELLGLKESQEDKSHASLLAVFIKHTLEENAKAISDLDAVAVCKGPGSYTGLRIGVSTAKGLAYGSGIPLISVDTLSSMATGVIHGHLLQNEALPEDKSFLLCPMIDARRMEVYTAVFLPSGEMIEPIAAKIIQENSFKDILEQNRVVFFGNGAAKCRDTIKHPNAIFLEGIETSASYMVSLAESAWQQKHFEDVAYFEPFYLKDFLATIPKNKVIK